MFQDRTDAGRQLADELLSLALHRPVVYALPRGGVPVAVEVAKRLRAPLDLVMVRKIGAPGSPEVALGAIVEGQRPETVINEMVRRHSGADDSYIESARALELEELERRRERYLGDRPRIDPAGCSAILVDDGLATGATMKAALIAIKRRGAARVVVAVPVAPDEALADMRALADTVVCLNPAIHFRGVGGFYRDFHQLTDEETTNLLREVWSKNNGTDGTSAIFVAKRQVSVPPTGLAGDLNVPDEPRGIILFAHGSGSSRQSPRNRAVAEALNARGFATLLLDLLTTSEAKNRRNVFDIPLLAGRLVEAAFWISSEPDVADLPLGIFGASTGAGAALMAAADLRDRVVAVVSRGGRPDLAGPSLPEVGAPTLLIVGGEDHQVIALNRKAHANLTSEKLLKLVPGATHLFEEPGALETVKKLAGDWFENYLASPPSEYPAQPQPPESVAAAIRAAAEPLPALDDPDFAAAFDRFATARVVLLGEATHGTSEFYQARTAITRHLIQRHGFSIVAVEADWPDAAAIDRDIRNIPRDPTTPLPFSRFPTWMWRNTDVNDFFAVLRSHNSTRPTKEHVRFCGLDLYSMSASIRAVLAYLDSVDPESAEIARARYACLSPWSRELAAYGRASLTEGFALCEQPVTRILVDLLKKELEYVGKDGDSYFDAAQNARLVANAERYYRVMYYGSHESWNLRDQHMFDTLQNVLQWAGPESKAVVWAHNSHIGDARFTEMGLERGELNIGQLCRQNYGRDAALIGFGTHTGTVAAASDWDAPMEVTTVRPSRPDSHGAVCHEIDHERFLLDMREGQHDDLRRALAEPRLERYIGVIYRPDTERWSHYSHAILSDEYDGFVWFDRTSAVTALPTDVAGGEDETFPFGL